MVLLWTDRDIFCNAEQHHGPGFIVPFEALGTIKFNLVFQGPETIVPSYMLSYPKFKVLYHSGLSTCLASPSHYSKVGGHLLSVNT